jgi:hypothetical protein
MRFGWLTCLLFALGGVAPVLAAPAGPDVVFPRPESAGDARTRYPELLLRLALGSSCPACRIRPSHLTLLQNRALLELERGTGEVNVVWSMTSIEREQRLLPVRFPLDKGLIGWRIPLVMPATEAKLATVSGLASLRRFSFGQGLDWPDTAILRGNQLNVQGVVQYETLFKMLAAGRFELFPRSLIEIGQEARAHTGEGMLIDRHIIIHYPAAFYFFVNRDNAALAARLARGLAQIRADGRFAALFERTFGAELAAAHLERRRVIELANPLLPAATPVGDAALWFHPSPSVR